MGEADEGPALARRAATQCGYLFVLAGLLAFAGIPTTPGSASVLLGIAVADFGVAVLCFLLPWRRWPVSRVAWVSLAGFAVAGLSTWAVSGFTGGTIPFYVLIFVWLGLHQAPRAIWLAAIPASLSYAGALVLAGAAPEMLGSTVVIMPVVVTVGLVTMVAAGCGWNNAVDSRTATAGLPTTRQLVQEHDWVLEPADSSLAVEGGGPVTLSVADDVISGMAPCNAYRREQDSVAQRVREAWDKTQGKRPTAVDFGLMYDSVEAPPDAPLTVAAAPDVVKAVRGDSTWHDLKRVTNSISNTAIPASESRRKWYNSAPAAEDAWCDPSEWDVLADSELVLADG
jgi:hypothetical protein